MFNKIAVKARNIDLVSGNVISGDPVFKFYLNDVPCELKVTSKVRFSKDETWISISVSLNSSYGANLFYSEVVTKEERAELLKMLDILDKAVMKERQKLAKELGEEAGLW